MIFAGILAGGVGSRIKNINIPKQFIFICGKSIFNRTLEAFYNVKEIDKIIIAINNNYKEMYTELLNESNVNMNKVLLTPGGENRFDSLINVVKKAKAFDDNNNSFILTHDCARCFVSKNIILKNIEEIKNNDLVTTTIPAIDSIWHIDNLNVKIIDKNKIFYGQSPQTFYIDTFLKLIKNKTKEQLLKYNEPGGLYIDNNKKLGFVAGNRELFKITTDFDVKLAEFLITNDYIE